MATCPFSQGKWNETHNFSKEVNSGDGVQDDVKKKADAKENKNNTLTNLKNNESKEQTSTVKIDKKLEKNLKNVIQITARIKKSKEGRHG